VVRVGRRLKRLGQIGALIRRYPVAASYIATVVTGLAARFGLDLDTAQVTAVVLGAAAVFASLAHASVTPVEARKPGDPL
jgi:phage shock protein PspC (stress-responsive transcriptional regulator)